MSSLPTKIPCPRCNTDQAVGRRAKVDGKIVYVFMRCSCGIQIQVAGEDEDPFIAEEHCLVNLREAWLKTRTLWLAFCDALEKDGLEIPKKVDVNVMHQTVMEFENKEQGK